MLKCPYCFEILEEKVKQCPHCQQFIIDNLVEVDYKGVDKKKCFFCGKSVRKEARVCKFCHKWLDEVDNAARDLE